MQAQPNGLADAAQTLPRRTATALPGISHDHLDVLQRAMLTDIADDMKLARGGLLDLRDRRDMSDGTYAEDALATVRRLRLGLDAMDALGWPNDPPVKVS